MEAYFSTAAREGVNTLLTPVLTPPLNLSLIHIYGIYTTRTSPSWPCLLMNARFSGQRRAAIDTREAGLTIVNLEVRDCPRAIEIEDVFC